MRHQKSRLRLKQKPAHARMMKRNLVTSLLLYESIRTTKNRAKVVQPVIDKLVRVANTRPPHIAIRYINQLVTDKNACRKIMEVYKDRYSSRTSGLTRMVPAGARKGDGAELVDLSLVDGVDSPGDRNPESGIRTSVLSDSDKDKVSSGAESRVPDSGFRSKKQSLKSKNS
ncbi:bL17 family ribosomal protein [Patescibacteria group bacterium]|nr:bL17 family ribosomal protein [Patescibacteria group bacterium]MBU1123404.1 bL17 family ribosomal protein [Patescibacteria group bacterium]MBU1911436.1 bL17 family ribosomal protein [Patescibacteria group bacterium]